MTLPADALVFFGASGDLAHKKVLPALYAMHRRGHLGVPVIGVAKSGWTREQFLERARSSVGGAAVDPALFARFAAHLRYVDGDYHEASTFERLRAELGPAEHPVHYLAIPPSLFTTVAGGLERVGCARGARVVVEKPFGRDLASAQALNRTLLGVFPESSIFRIDHYLGKEPVQNLLYFRFSNPFLAPLWNRDVIRRVQLTMAESFGVEGRGRFYEEMGTIRDVIQNHALQVIASIAMNAPAEAHGEALRDEKARLLSSIRPLGPEDIVRGQFRGYRDEPEVARDSRVETFAAVRLHLDSARWAGVPFFVRAGKRLPVTCTEVLVELHAPARSVFGEALGGAGHSNYLRFRLGPDVAIALGVRTKSAGEAMIGTAAELLAVHRAGDEMEPYERLLHDAMLGDQGLFAREDGVEAAWRVVAPVLGEVSPVHEYAPGTWGPIEVDRLAAEFGGWTTPS